MSLISANEQESIINVLSKKNAINQCPRCNQKAFTLLDGYFNQSIQATISGNLVLGGPSIPSVVVVCNNCGYMSQHALGVLGLMPNVEEKK